ncbi:rab domain-containing cell division control protein [Sanghuangporus baumii]|uniref:Rab domain-containing cell division control protein n=1 Tax=Sanghuangporus baumii TaxID=108892 RepID=A0A9Q5NEH9_SANBA|nr:rab domain-containing cell division control protein [Sanghuangporus baumii]
MSLTEQTAEDAQRAARTINRILNQPKLAGSAQQRTDKQIEEGIKKLRRVILVEGIPHSVDPTLRPRVWKILLGVNNISADKYLRYVRRGPCEFKEKIRNDTFRTLATDRGFKERVREDMLVRLLDAFVWRNHERQERAEAQRIHPPPLTFTYVQGMNVLAAPFLYTMPSELDAFFCFARFIEHSCPLYVQQTLEDQVLQLWDFLLAFGVHLNVLCVIAQLLLIRDELMATPRPMKLLRTLPPLEAQPVIGIAVTLVRDIPADLYDELVRHPFEVR